MKIIDAFWEKKNLNKKTIEIKFEENENFDTILFNEIISGFEYVVVKIPVNSLYLVQKITEENFMFVESNFQLTCNLNNFNLNPIQSRIGKEISSKEITSKDDFEKLESEIKKGIFKTDRIALDVNFGIDIANHRFMNWINDELILGSKIYLLIYKNRDFGFLGLKKINNDVYYPFLGGVYNEFSNSGLGFAMLSECKRIVVELKGKKLNTFVSSNNLPVLKLHLNLGFEITSITNVFTKHLNKNNE